jgi:hypothetical protein
MASRAHPRRAWPSVSPPSDATGRTSDGPSKATLAMGQHALTSSNRHSFDGPFIDPVSVEHVKRCQARTSGVGGVVSKTVFGINRGLWTQGSWNTGFEPIGIEHGASKKAPDLRGTRLVILSMTWWTLEFFAPDPTGVLMLLIGVWGDWGSNVRERKKRASFVKDKPSKASIVQSKLD